MVPVQMSESRADKLLADRVLPLALDARRTIPLRILLGLTIQANGLSVSAFALSTMRDFSQCLLPILVQTCSLALQSTTGLPGIGNPIDLLLGPSKLLSGISFGITRVALQPLNVVIVEVGSSRLDAGVP